jgi:5-methylthioadenosine/S-adenosylhomocysteine deaminase
MSGLLIRGGLVLDPDRPLHPADVRVEGDTISEVESGLTASGERVIDAGGMIVMPGLINAHTHSCQSVDQGTTPNLPLDLWMMWVVYGGLPFSTEDYYTAAAAGALEMLRTGCTAVLDHAPLMPEAFEEQADATMAAYDDLGLRAAVAPLVEDRDFYESLPLHLVEEADRPAPLSEGRDPEWLAGTQERFLETWAGRHPRLRAMLGPSAPQRCSDDFLGHVSALARRHGVGVHTHLLETKSQVYATRERYGRSVVDHLDDLGLVGPHASFAHALWLEAPEYERLLERGATLVHNPISNLRCGSGVMPLKYLLAKNAVVAVGSDGAASNDNQNMFEAMKFATLLHTLDGDFRSWPKATDLWCACLRGGAAALDWNIGSVAPGGKADLVLLSSQRHATASHDGLVASLVHSEHGESVDTVVVGGEVVMEGRSPTRVSETEILARAAELRDRLHRHLEQRMVVYSRAEGVLGRMLDAVEAEPLDLPLRGLPPVA